MPVIRCSNGKYRIGNGECMYTTYEAAKKAERAWLASLSPKERKRELAKWKKREVE